MNNKQEEQIMNEASYLTFKNDSPFKKSTNIFSNTKLKNEHLNSPQLMKKSITMIIEREKENYKAVNQTNFTYQHPKDKDNRPQQYKTQNEFMSDTKTISQQNNLINNEDLNEIIYKVNMVFLEIKNQTTLEQVQYLIQQLFQYTKESAVYLTLGQDHINQNNLVQIQEGLKSILNQIENSYLLDLNQIKSKINQIYLIYQTIFQSFGIEMNFQSDQTLNENVFKNLNVCTNQSVTHQSTQQKQEQQIYDDVLSDFSDEYYEVEEHQKQEVHDLLFQLKEKIEKPKVLKYVSSTKFDDNLDNNFKSFKQIMTYLYEDIQPHQLEMLIQYLNLDEFSQFKLQNLLKVLTTFQMSAISNHLNSQYFDYCYSNIRWKQIIGNKNRVQLIQDTINNILNTVDHEQYDKISRALDSLKLDKVVTKKQFRKLFINQEIEGLNRYLMKIIFKLLVNESTALSSQALLKLLKTKDISVYCEKYFQKNLKIGDSLDQFEQAQKNIRKLKRLFIEQEQKFQKMLDQLNLYGQSKLQQIKYNKFLNIMLHFFPQISKNELSAVILYLKKKNDKVYVKQSNLIKYKVFLQEINQFEKDQQDQSLQVKGFKEQLNIKTLKMKVDGLTEQNLKYKEMLPVLKEQILRVRGQREQLSQDLDQFQNYIFIQFQKQLNGYLRDQQNQNQIMIQEKDEKIEMQQEQISNLQDQVKTMQMQYNRQINQKNKENNQLKEQIQDILNSFQNMNQD